MSIETGFGVALGFLFGIIGHEVVQHRVAFALGDKTPRLMGRMQFSPKAHFDPLGTAILPGIFTVAALFSNPLTPMFGWGKRHAINPSAFRDPRKGVIISSLSGPVTNALIALVSGRLAASIGAGSTSGRILLWVSLVNLFLMIIEILPIPGRDGARILALFLSPSAAAKLDDLAQYEILFLLVIFLFLGGVVNNMVRVACGPIAGLERLVC